MSNRCQEKAAQLRQLKFVIQTSLLPFCNKKGGQIWWEREQSTDQMRHFFSPNRKTRNLAVLDFHIDTTNNNLVVKGAWPEDVRKDAHIHGRSHARA